jgi:hypothetical protein
MRSEKRRGCSSTSLGHTEALLDEAELNLERCLDALDQKGEAGLQVELDRIYQPEIQPSDQRKSAIGDETLAPPPLALSMLLTVTEYCSKQGVTAAGAVGTDMQNGETSE